MCGGGGVSASRGKNTKSVPILEERGVYVVGSRVDFVESEIAPPPPRGCQNSSRIFLSLGANKEK